MLEAMNPGELAELMAAEVADPGDSWRQTAQLSELIYMVYEAVIIAASGGETRPDERTRDSFLPKWSIDQPDEPEPDPAEELAPSVADDLQEHLRRGE